MKIYLAGGMKTAWQDRVINEFKEDKDLFFFDPRSHGLTKEEDYTKWDLDAIKESDLVFAYMDWNNPSGYGLSLEVGFAFALNKTIWYICEDDLESRQKYFGMVRACANHHYDSLQQAINSLRML